MCREDPEIAAILTKPFLKEFKDEFDRMVRERREGVAQSQEQVTLLALMHANGWQMRHRLFDALVEQYSSIDKLDLRLRPLVIMKLVQHCGLPGSGLL